ncbi:30S ribosomal protein S16 [Lentisphaera profundi]|uniref:30S ribosomal protein S16 n=1 Tax=Lentisphaera profundi TaxID=1658616 RepID=UPI0030825DB3
MVKIRLTRTGKKNAPSFRIVVVDARVRRDGAYIEKLGHYAPIREEEVVNVERAEYWIARGAQATSTVKDIIRRAKTGEPTRGLKGQKKSEEPKAEATEKVAEPVKEAAEAAE